MRHLFIKTVAGCGLLLMTTIASAQSRPLYPDRPYPDRPQDVQQDRREGQARDALFDRVRTDLDHIHAGTLPFSADRGRVSVAIEQLNECQSAINAGEYDRRQFDRTVASLQRVIDLNHLTDQTRGYLSDDVRELSMMQNRLEGY